MWSFKEGCKNKHWVFRTDICQAKMEGGLGFRSLFDVSRALFAKLWWNFRTKHSMWSHFMWNKYCKKCRPQIVEWKGGSQTWKYMLQARDSIDKEIWWQPNNGSSSIMFDNWSQIGALLYCLPVSFSSYLDQEDISQLMIQGKWNEELLRHILLEGVADHIIKNIDIVQECEEMDKPYWMLNHSGKFSIRSSWESLRTPGVYQEEFRQVWKKGVLFKISFFF